MKFKFERMSRFLGLLRTNLQKSNNLHNLIEYMADCDVSAEDVLGNLEKLKITDKHACMARLIHISGGIKEELKLEKQTEEIALKLGLDLSFNKERQRFFSGRLIAAMA